MQVPWDIYTVSSGLFIGIIQITTTVYGCSTSGKEPHSKSILLTAVRLVCAPAEVQILWDKR